MSDNKPRYTLGKEERLHAQKRIDALFALGESFIAYPLRVVYTRTDKQQSLQQTNAIMVSVSKKRFKRAVKRNQVKRLVKEAYRLNKQPFINLSDKLGQTFDIAFIYLKTELPDYAEIEKAIHKTINTITQKHENIKNENPT